MKLKQVIEKLEQFAPPELASFDYVGLIQGDLDQEINKIGLTLDYSLQAIERSIADGCQLLITHHGPTDINFPLSGNKLAKHTTAANAKLAVYRCHLNLDFCKGGIIEELSNLLGLPTKPVQTNYHMTLNQLLKRTEALKTKYVRIAGKKKDKFERIAITSGKGFIDDFMDQSKAEVYIAGEFEQEATKYAEDLGIMLIELSHHASESRPLEVIRPKLEKLLGLEVVLMEISDTIEVISIEKLTAR
jgi:dinuclear metal center YbgI/SA1388 family protein